MAFLSASSKARTKSTVNKLFENVLPGSNIVLAPANPLSSTEVISKHINKKNLSKNDITKLNKAERAKRNKQIKKKLQSDKKFLKLVKYNIIKAHKDAGSTALSPEEQKYLLKLIKKNSNSVKRNAEAIDTDIQEEIDELQNEIIEMSNEKYNRLRDRKKDTRLKTFDPDADPEDLDSDQVAYPGLTPGLAPVGMDDDEDSEEEDY